MATSQLGLYNIALFAVGERPLSSLTEDREPRRLLDEIWTRGGGGTVRYVLEQGLWNFATRAVQIDADSEFSPTFGFTNAFTLPEDMVRMIEISADDEFGDPLHYYDFEAHYIYASVDPIFLKYVSDHTSYGGDLSLWPETFTLYAGHWMATQLAPRLTNDVEIEALKMTTMELLVSARLKDASQDRRPWPPLELGDMDHRELDHSLEIMRIIRRNRAEQRKEGQ